MKAASRQGIGSLHNGWIIRKHPAVDDLSTVVELDANPASVQPVEAAVAARPILQEYDAFHS